jgi:hypothetical protein
MNPTDSIKKTARRAGLLWLLTAIAGGFGFAYIRSSVIVTGDAAATAGNLLASETMFRAAVTGCVIAEVFLFFFALQLFRLFKEFDKRLATILLLSVLMTVGIGVVNQVNNFGALYVLTQPDFLKAFSAGQIDTIAAFLLRQANNTGQGLLEIFWVPYYFSFGLLVIRSGYLPKILGILLMIMSFGFAVNLLDKFLIPTFYPEAFTRLAMTLGALGGIPTMLWLLIKGANPKETACE